MRVSLELIKDVRNHWDEQETQDIIAAIKVELKKDYRSWQNKNYNDEALSMLSSLIDNIDNSQFWDQLHFLLNYFQFDY